MVVTSGPKGQEMTPVKDETPLPARAAAAYSFVLCADDFALSPGVSRGILAALGAGRLNATSVMTTRPAWARGASALRPYQRAADIGLHLNLTLGRPLGTMRFFAPSGEMPDIGRVLRAAQKGELPEHEIRSEIGRQLDSFVDQFGAPPAFVDGHQHVQILPQIRYWLFDCLEQRGLAGKIWLRNSGDRTRRILRRGVELTKALGITYLARGFAREAHSRGFATNEGFAGFSAFDPCRDFASDFTRYLKAPGTHHLVMCHPGYCDEELVTIDPVTLTRERELSFLLSPMFPAILASHKARLAPLGVRE
jgi:hypothetical protein